MFVCDSRRTRVYFRERSSVCHLGLPGTHYEARLTSCAIISTFKMCLLRETGSCDVTCDGLWASPCDSLRTGNSGSEKTVSPKSEAALLNLDFTGGETVTPSPTSFPLLQPLSATVTVARRVTAATCQCGVLGLLCFLVTVWGREGKEGGY